MKYVYAVVSYGLPEIKIFKTNKLAVKWLRDTGHFCELKRFWKTDKDDDEFFYVIEKHKIIGDENER